MSILTLKCPPMKVIQVSVILIFPLWCGRLPALLFVCLGPVCWACTTSFNLGGGK